VNSTYIYDKFPVPDEIKGTCLAYIHELYVWTKVGGVGRGGASVIFSLLIAVIRVVQS
jgi:hypothetical protein